MQNGYQISFQSILSSRFFGSIGNIIFFFTLVYSLDSGYLNAFQQHFSGFPEISLKYHAYLMCWMISL